MDSKQRKSIALNKVLLRYFVIVILVVTILNGFGVNLEVYAYDASQVSSKEKTSIPIFSELITDVEWINEYNITNVSNVSLNLSQSLKEKFIKVFNIEVDGYEIIINDETYGCVSSNEERDSIIQYICNSYVKKLELDPKDIIQIGIISEVEAIPCKVDYESIEEVNIIAKRIYEKSLQNEELLGVRILAKSSELNEIEYSTITESSEDLYMGESKEIIGENGVKRVFKEVTFDGVNKIKEVVVNENILIEPKPTVIMKGTRNPYDDGIAFLSMPTMGGYMSSEYGEERYSSYHKGIDIAKDLGEDVNAAFDGKVITAGYNNGGYGNLIIIEHENNMKTYYAHLNDIYVKVGDVIKKGKKIGTVGNTGLSTGPHLHFELRINDEPVDPTNYIVGL